MNKLLFTAALLLCASYGLAQKKTKSVYDAKFELSEEIKGQKGLGFMTLGSDGTNTYSMSTKGVLVGNIPVGFKFVLNKFDGKMNHMLSENVPMKTGVYKIGYYSWINMNMVGKRIIQTVSGYNKKAGEENMYVVEYSTQTLKPIARLKVGSFKAKGKTKSKNTIATFSDPENDQEFAVVVQSSKTSKTSKKSTATVYIVNEDLEVSLKTTFGITGSYEQTRFINYMIKDDYVAFVCIVRGEKDEEDRAHFYRVDRRTKTVNSFEISMRDIGNDISDFECAVHEDGRLFVSGFYKADGKKTNDAGGAFTQLYSIEDGEFINQDIHPFTFDFMTENMSDRQKNKAERRSGKGKDIDAYDFLVREVITNENGSSTLVAERYRYYTTTYTDSKGNSHTTHHYIHADLITMQTNAEGEIEWVERFKKFNHSTNNPAEGAFLFRNEEDFFYIIYYEEGILKIARISKENGSGKAKDVLTKKEIGKYAVSISHSVQVNETTYLTQFVRMRKARLLTITFDN